MTVTTLGALFSLGALITWGLGDFFTQKEVKRFGDWESLFTISFIGVIFLFPFILNDLKTILNLSLVDWAALTMVSISFFVAALIGLEAYKRGKLAVIEPLGAVEIPISALLAFIFLGEAIALQNIFLITLLVVGLMLASLRSYHLNKHLWLEKGIVWALISGFSYGLTDFMVAYSSRTASPLITVWIFNVVLAFTSLVYIIFHGRLKKTGQDFKNHTREFLSAGIFDNLGWLFFGLATKYLLIGLALALSESYIIVAVLLGIFISKEKVMNHQKIGIALAMIMAIILSRIL